MNGLQKVIKYCAMAFAIFLSVVILGSIITAVLGVTTGIAGINALTREDKDRISLSEEYSLEEAKALEITSILVDCNAEITVKEGEVLAIEASDVTDEYEIRQSNGKFSIVQDRPDFNINFVWFDDVAVQEKVVVTIPEELCPEQIKINSGSGAVSVTEVAADNLTVDSGSGRVTMEKVEADRLLVDSGSGKVAVTNAKCKNTELYTGSGGISVENSELGEFRLDSGSGTVRMDRVVATNANVDSGSGKVSYTGVLTGTCEFETGSGALTISLDGQEEEYRVKAECGSGTFRINGKKVDDGSYGSNVRGELLIDSGSGSVNVEFNTSAEE